MNAGACADRSEPLVASVQAVIKAFFSALYPFVVYAASLSGTLQGRVRGGAICIAASSVRSV